MKFKVKALINFNDLEEGKHRKIGEKFICTKERTDFLIEHKAVEIIESIEMPKLKEITIENVDKALKDIHESAKEEIKRTRKKKTSKK